MTSSDDDTNLTIFVSDLPSWKPYIIFDLIKL